MSYKSFRKQFIECKKNGNLKKVECPWCSRTLLVCVKYGSQCMSSKCRDERIKEE